MNYWMKQQSTSLESAVPKTKNTEKVAKKEPLVFKKNNLFLDFENVPKQVSDSKCGVANWNSGSLI